MQKVLKKIKKEPLPRALLVHGPELALQEQVLHALRAKIGEGEFSDWNWGCFYGHKDFNATALLADLATIPWGDAPKIVVLKETHLIPANTMEHIVHWLADNAQANSVAFFLPKLDRRLRYVRALLKFAWEIECAPLQGSALTRYVQDYCLERGRKIGEGARRLFLERTGDKLLFIQNELDKLVAYTEGKTEINKEDVQHLTSLSPAQIANNTVFQMTDFLARGQRAQALAVLELLGRAGEPPLRILPLIERHLRLLLAAKTTQVSLEETARQMGESSSYALQKIKAQAKSFTVEEILAGFAAIVQGDREIKLGTPGEEVLADIIVKLT